MMIRHLLCATLALSIAMPALAAPRAAETPADKDAQIADLQTKVARLTAVVIALKAQRDEANSRLQDIDAQERAQAIIQQAQRPQPPKS